MQRRTTIYIVDDDPGIIEAVSHLVKPTGATVETCSRADAFLAGYRPIGPACLVLDVRMPGMSGLDLQKRLVEAGHTIPVIIVTGHADVKMAVDAVRAGAYSLIEKPFRPQDLFDEIQRAICVDEEAWRRRDEEESVERRLALLKPGEREVLDLVAAGMTNEQIAERLKLSVRGVEARRAKASKKLGVHSCTELRQLLQPTAGAASDSN